MKEPNEDPNVGQDVTSLAQDLFGEPNPDIEGSSSTTTEENNEEQNLNEGAALFGVESGADTQAETETQTQVQQPVVQQQEQQPQFTAEQIQQFQAWQQSQQQQVQQPVVQQQQPLPDEEVAKLTNRFTMTEKEFDAIYEAPDKQTAIAAFNHVLQGVVKQAVTMASYLAMDQAQQVTQQVRPYMQFADSQRELMLRQNFYEANPELKGADVIVEAVLGNLTNSGQKFTSHKQLFDAVAKASKDQLVRLGGQGQRNGNAQPKVKQPMAAMPNGSQGGNGSRMAPTGSGVQQTAKSIFG